MRNLNLLVPEWVDDMIDLLEEQGLLINTKVVGDAKTLGVNFDMDYYEISDGNESYILTSINQTRKTALKPYMLKIVRDIILDGCKLKGKIDNFTGEDFWVRYIDLRNDNELLHEYIISLYMYGSFIDERIILKRDDYKNYKYCAYQNRT